MARYDCNRCRAVLNTTMDPHLCKDVQQRLKEATRRANEPCQGRGSLDSWLVQMQHTSPHAKPPKQTTWDWVVNGHGQLLDPATDVLDDVAKRMLAARSNRA